MDNDQHETSTITFKKRKRKINAIKSIVIDDDDDNDLNKSGDKLNDDTNNDNQSSNSNDVDNETIDWKTLIELRELQKLRKRKTNGIDVNDLLKTSTNSKNPNEDDNSKNKKLYGLQNDAKSLAESELDLGNTFSLETNRRDEDAEMMKFVDDELKKRRQMNKMNENDNDNDASNKQSTPAIQSNDLLLKSIPNHLLQLMNLTANSKTKNEEMLSSQMLSGIPEIDLGIDERIKNIEKTEAARNQLLEKRLKYEQNKQINNSDRESSKEVDNLSFAPKNFASCYRNNSNHRFNLNPISMENKDLINHFQDDNSGNNNNNRNRNHKHSNQNQQQQQAQQYDIEPVVVIGDEPLKVQIPRPVDKDNCMPSKDKPLDNYMFEKFKKHIRKR